MHFHIIFSILVICATSQINAKPIDDKELPELLSRSAEIKYNLAKSLQEKIDKGTVTNEDREVVRSMWDLSALVKQNIIYEIEQRLKALNTTTESINTPTLTTPTGTSTSSTSPPPAGTPTSSTSPPPAGTPTSSTSPTSTGTPTSSTSPPPAGTPTSSTSPTSTGTPTSSTSPTSTGTPISSTPAPVVKDGANTLDDLFGP